MKKIIKWAVYCFAAFCAFCILVAVFTDDEKSTSNSSKETQQEERVVDTKAQRQAREQKAEAERQAQEQKAEAERQARENMEKESQVAQKKKNVEEKAYEAGYRDGLSKGPVTYRNDNPKDAARIYYNTVYGIPSNSEEKEMLNLFLEHYVRGYHDGYKSKEE